MKKKKLLAVSAALLMSVSMACTAYAGSWKETEGGWKYELDSGGYARGRWVEDGGNWYYIEKDGYMRTGWLQDDGKWYYLDADGAMLRGVTRNIGGADYSFDENGAMEGGEGSSPAEEASASLSGAGSGWNGLTYTNVRLDFQLTVPEGFLDMNYNPVSLDRETTKVEMSASAPDNTVAVVVATFLIPAEESGQVTADGMARSMRQDLENTGQYDGVGEVSEVTLGGYQYFKLPMSYRGALNQDLYFRRSGEELILMQMVYEPGHKPMADGIVDSIRQP